MMYYDTEYESMLNEANYAIQIAQRMLKKHGYWVAMYNCMTLAIHCRKKRNTEWDEEELIAVTFWWGVRNLIYKSR